MSNSLIKRELQAIRRRLWRMRVRLERVKQRVDHAVHEAAEIRAMSRAPAHRG